MYPGVVAQLGFAGIKFSPAKPNAKLPLSRLQSQRTFTDFLAFHGIDPAIYDGDPEQLPRFIRLVPAPAAEQHATLAALAAELSVKVPAPVPSRCRSRFDWSHL
jgi:hypothetical protein